MFYSLGLVCFIFLMQQRHAVSAHSGALAAPLAPSNVHLVELTLILQTMS